MSKIITVSGKARHGKDTFALAAQKYYESMNKKCLIFHYADVLKFICKEYFGWNGIKDERGRSMLQHVGTDIVRRNSPDCWVNIASEIIKGFGDTFDYIIIADTRFPNEITHWVETQNPNNVLNVRIERPNFDNGLTEEQKRHPSETLLDKWHFDSTIVNDCSIEEFGNRVEYLLKTRNF